MIKKLKRLLLLSFIGAAVYAVTQKLKEGQVGEVPLETEPEEEVTAVGPDYEIDESKLGGEVSQDLLEILVCPDDKQDLEYVDGKWLVCHTCGRRYPIVEGIPVMLIEVGDKYRDEGLIREPA
jgi:uncharacterized protein YbaR (Trm112 family)